MTSPETDTPQPEQPAEPAATTHDPRQLSVRSLVLGAAIGLVVGAGAIGLAWGLSGGGGEGATADAEAACAVLDRTGTFRADDEAAFTRWGAAHELATAAAKLDQAYQPLADALREARDVMIASFSTDSPEFAAANSRAKDFCAGM